MTNTVLITGASSGIGKATVEAFAAAGWNVAATSRQPDASAFSMLGNVKQYPLDVTDPASITAAFDSAIADFGGIDVVVNNAGYGLDGVFEAIDDATIAQVFDTNVFGLMRVTRAAISVMRPRRSGTIIQIASMGGRLTFPLYSVYHSTKWAVDGFAESLHYELGQFGIKMRVIEPGVIKTNFYSKGRVFVTPPSELGYDDFVSKVEKVTRSSGESGEDPSVVAKTVLKAATSRSKKLRYVVGKPARSLLILRRIVPERLFYFVVRKSFKL